jgi:hypothetical protein
MAMCKEKIRSLPLYPEKRKCKYPTTARIVDLFSNIRRHILFEDGDKVKCFYDPISELQEQILDLLIISKGHYTC